MPKIKIFPVLIGVIVFYVPVWLALRYLSLDAARFVVFLSGFVAGFLCADLSTIAPYWQTFYAIIFGKLIKEEIVLLMLLDERVIKTSFRSFGSFLAGLGGSLQAMIAANIAYLALIVISTFFGAYLAERNNQAHRLLHEQNLKAAEPPPAAPKIVRVQNMSSVADPQRKPPRIPPAR